MEKTTIGLVTPFKREFDNWILENGAKYGNATFVMVDRIESVMGRIFNSYILLRNYDKVDSRVVFALKCRIVAIQCKKVHTPLLTRNKAKITVAIAWIIAVASVVISLIV